MSGDADAPASPDAPGWYGKLSILGDFAHRRLPAEFIRIGDAWLSQVMSAGHQQLGDRWLGGYLTAPVMRFAWAPGVAGSSWWFGLLMPSCDNVGRYFPLLIAHQRDHPPLGRSALDHLEAWFDHLAAAAALTLGERASVESFEQALSDAPPWPTCAAPTARLLHATAGVEHYRLGRHATLYQWLRAVATDDLHAHFAGCSIWWRPGTGGHDATATGTATASVVRGLPDAAWFARMLSGA